MEKQKKQPSSEAAKQMNQNGDCILEEKLGDAVTVSVADEDFGAVVICALRYCLGRRTYMPGLVINYVTPLLPHISDNTLRCMDADLSKPDLYGGFGDERIDEPLWVKFHDNVQEEIANRKETAK